MANNTPAWAIAMFAIAVFEATLGSIFLLMRKKVAGTLFVVYFLALLIDMGHTFFAGLGADAYGPGGIKMPIMIFGIGGFLIWYAKNATKKGWLS